MLDSARQVWLGAQQPAFAAAARIPAKSLAETSLTVVMNLPLSSEAFETSRFTIAT